MLIEVSHRTIYRYEQPIAYSIQSLRMTPKSRDGQQVLSWMIDAGSEATLSAGRDGFGNIDHLLVIDRPHDALELTVQGVVECEDRAGVVKARTGDLPLGYYLRDTQQTGFAENMSDLVEPFEEKAHLDQLHTLMHRVRDRVDYEVGASDAATTAEQAVAQGRGVCQDHAHVFLACARRLGIPARYVSGYLCANPDEVQDYEAAHAWAEAFVNGLGWVGFDVANRICPNDAYVRIAAGLDYGQAAPIRGVRRGGGEEEMQVNVRIADQSQAQNQA